MALLIFAIVIVIIAGLLAWAVDQSPLSAPVNWIVKAGILLVAALVIAQRAGLA